MRMFRNITLVAVFAGLASTTALGQVGIGIANPDTLSILDLTNTNGKGLKLPYLSGTPTAGAGAAGLLMYYKQDLYFRDTTGFNIVNPWKYKYNGSNTEAVYFNPTGYVGVGIGVSDANVKGNLHVALSGKDVVPTSTNAALFIGDRDDTTHMSFDIDEIMVKTNTNTLGILKLQDGSGGTVQIGQDITNKSNLNVFGKVKEHGNDLVPQGVIVMWSGLTTNVPNGWALCDGQKYQINTSTGATEVNAAGVQTPNLSGKFIVAAGNNGTSSYSPGNQGGQDNVTLVVQNLPYHAHNGYTNTTGAHTHTFKEFTGWAEAGGSYWQNIVTRAGSTNTATSSDGDHSHSVTTNSCVNCNAQAFNNRPKYYSLAYIMKL